MPPPYDFDVIIVGSGLAAHASALEALDRKARVLMIEAAPTLGGSTNLSSGVVMGAGTRFQKQRGISDTAEGLYEEYMAFNQWALQPSVARRFCLEAGKTVEWLADNGVEYTDVISSGMERSPRGHKTRGGDAIIASLQGRIAQSDKFESVVATRVDRLLIKDGCVTGVASDEDKVTAPSVILACGGMGANAEMISHWHPEAFWSAEGALSYVGHAHARGDIISLAGQVGAQIVQGRGIRNPACVLLTGYWPSFTVVVNQLGRRFMAENIAYSIAELLLPRQPGGVAYMLFDDAIKRSLKTTDDVAKYIKITLEGDDFNAWRSESIDDYVERKEIVKAQSLAELAQLLGIPPANLEGTVKRYNRMVAAQGDGDYLKEGITPPLATPPYYAAKITQPFYAFTGTGVRIDENAGVIHETSEPIPGLFAAGECVGNVLGGIYFGSGNALANCAVFGKIAGQNAAARALSVKPVPV